MSAAPIVLRADLRKNPDGTLRTTNPFGDFNPAPATLAVDQNAFFAALGSQVGLFTGRPALSLNLRGAWLTGSEAGTCTFAVRTISGDAVGTHGWSVASATFAQPYTAGSVGSGVLEVYALDSGGHELSFGHYSWSILASSGADTLAPTIPTGLRIIGGTGVLNCTINAATDRYDGSVSPSGLDHYAAYVDGVFRQNVAATQGPAPQFTLTNIGSISPTPTAVHNAGTWTLTAAGIGVNNNTAEECVFEGAALAGDADLTVKLDAFTSANEFSTSGIMIRETLAQGAIFAALYVQPSALAHGLQVKRRNVTGGVGTNVASVNSLTSAWVRLTRAGNNITASYSTDGNTFTDIATIALPMASTAYWGLFLSSQTAGSTCTSTIREVNLNEVADVSFTITTTGTHTVTVKSVDVTGNTSAAGAGVSASAGAVTTSGALKQHGGNYLYLDRNASSASKLARIANFAGIHASNRGVQDIIFWSKLENPDVPGDYSGNWDASGDSGVKYFAKMLKACRDARPADPLRYMFQVSPYGFAGTNKSATNWPVGFAPRYLSAATYGPSNAVESTGVWGGVWINTATMTSTKGASVGYFFRWWVPAVMDRLIAMMNFYGSYFDNVNPALNAVNSDLMYMVAFLSESVTPLYTTYTDDAAIAQYARYFPAGRSAFATCRLRFWGNYLQDNSRCVEVLRLLAPYFWDVGGADLCNEGPPFQTFGTSSTRPRAIPFNRAFRGINPVSLVADPSYENYVSRFGWVGEIEPDEQGPRKPATGTNDWTGNPATGSGNWPDYFDHANQQGANHITMFDNGYTGNNTHRFSGFVNTQPTHPNAQDWLISLGTDGSNVNGATMGFTLTYKDIYPSDYPT